MKSLSLIDYKNKFYTKFTNSKFQIIEFIGTKHVKIEDKYGKYIVLKSKLLITGNVSILSSIDKTECLINRLKEFYGDKYNYSLVKWVNSKHKITLICNKHGIYKVQTNSLLQNQGGCKLCGNEKNSINSASNNINFISKSNIVHNFFYDYSKTFYSRSFNSVEIICPKHGKFKQKANHHLQGHGCKKCANIKISIFNSESAPGWNLSTWIKSANNSKNFDSYKIYIIKCWNDDEEFYKIGRTFKTVKNRFKYKNNMPYNYKIIYSYKGLPEEIYNLEIKMKKENKLNKYIPKLKFDGIQECYILKKTWLENLFMGVQHERI